MIHSRKFESEDEIECVNWDSETKEWNSDGCKLITFDSFRLETVCECNHSSYFAAMVHPNEKNLRSSISYACFCISSFFILLTLKITRISLFNNKNHLVKKSDKFSLNICVCLLIINLLILGKSELKIFSKVK